MALIILGATKCALCGTVVESVENIFATSGVFFPQYHRLVHYCDVPMHWSCYENWPDRAEFAKAHLQMHVEWMEGNFYWGVAYQEEDILLLTINPNTEMIVLYLGETGTDIRMEMADWKRWLKGDWARTKYRLEYEALSSIVPRLSALFPNSQTVMDAVDWTSKTKQLEHRMEQAREQLNSDLRKPIVHNKTCRSLARNGLSCPFCNAPTPEHIAPGPEVKSSFACRKCGQSFGPIEVIVEQMGKGAYVYQFVRPNTAGP
jgi:hypothetical protein